MRGLIARTRPDIVVLSEQKSSTIEVVSEAWPGAKVEYIPAWRKDFTSGPRSGAAMMIHPAIDYHVAHGYDFKNTTSNGVMQALTVALPG